MTNGLRPGGTQRPRVIFIASLNRSGSTLLHLMLSSLPGVVGIGELPRVYDELTRHDGISQMGCQCGRPAAECPVWSQVISVIGTGSLDQTTLYRHVIHAVVNTYGPGVTMIDSSKRIGYLDKLTELSGEIDISIIRLVRDVRGWSFTKRTIPERDWDNHRIPYRIRRSYASLFRMWKRRNVKMDQATRSLGLPVAHISYEQYANQPDRYIRELASKLDIAAPEGLELAQAESHMLAGNLMRFDSE